MIVRLRVHQSALRRARVNLHACAPAARDVLQVARAATQTSIARPRSVPTQWRRLLVEDHASNEAALASLAEGER